MQGLEVVVGQDDRARQVARAVGVELVVLGQRDRGALDLDERRERVAVVGDDGRAGARELIL